MSEQNKAHIRRLIEEVYNKGDLDAVAEVAASDLVIHAAVRRYPRARRSQGVRGRAARRVPEPPLSPSRTRSPKATWW